MFILDWPLRSIHSSVLSSLNPTYKVSGIREGMRPWRLQVFVLGKGLFIYQASYETKLRQYNCASEIPVFSIWSNIVVPFFATNFHSICHANAQHMLYWLLIRDSQDDLQAFALHLPIRERPFGSKGCLRKARRFTPPPHHAAITTKAEVPLPQNTRQAWPFFPYIKRLKGQSSTLDTAIPRLLHSVDGTNL